MAANTGGGFFHSNGKIVSDSGQVWYLDEGYSPSVVDAQAFEHVMKNSLLQDSPKSYPNVYRWSLHIKSFKPEDMKNFRVLFLRVGFIPLILSAFNSE